MRCYYMIGTDGRLFLHNAHVSSGVEIFNSRHGSLRMSTLNFTSFLGCRFNTVNISVLRNIHLQQNSPICQCIRKRRYRFFSGKVSIWCFTCISFFVYVVRSKCYTVRYSEKRVQMIYKRKMQLPVQTAHPRRLIWNFVVRMCPHTVLFHCDASPSPLQVIRQQFSLKTPWLRRVYQSPKESNE